MSEFIELCQYELRGRWIRLAVSCWPVGVWGQWGSHVWPADEWLHSDYLSCRLTLLTTQKPLCHHPLDRADFMQYRCMCMRVSSQTLFYLFPSDWPSGSSKHVPAHKRCVQSAESRQCDVQNTSKSTVPDSSSWIFPLLELQLWGRHGSTSVGATGIGHQCHSFFSLLYVLTHYPNHLLHP